LRSYSSRDAAALQRALLALYSHRDLESFRMAVPAIFMAALGADYFMLRDARRDSERKTVTVLNFWESRPLFDGARIKALERNLFDHPFTQHALEHGATGALMLSDFWTLRQLRATALYREVFTGSNIGRVLSIGSFGGPGVATLTVTRPETAPNFSERDRHMLETLAPHFDQARANLERETRLRANRSASLKSHGLTPRETEIALWLAQGKSNPDIATILATPVRTIEKHIERILDKMGVENRAAAAVAVAEIVRA
jgi:DNA-binding CsgD family transcriptional regulator